MARYSYKKITKENKLIGGLINAFSKSSALRELRNNGSTVLFVLRDDVPFWKRDMPLPSFGMSTMERILFFRNTAVMLASGVSLIEALHTLEEQMRSSSTKKAMKKMSEDVANGQALSAAMGKFKRYFSEYLIETVNLGEVTGELSDTLDRVSTNLEKDYELRRKVVGAIAYPVIVILVMLAVIFILITFVLPKIAELFDEVNAELPFLTKVLINTSVFVVTYPYIIAGIIATIVTAFIFAGRTKRGRLIIHGSYLRIPIIGGLLKEFNLAQFFRSMDSMVSAGISLVKAVEVSKKTLRNEVYRTTLESVHPALTHGVQLSEALKPFPHIFPTQTQKIIKVGEQSGRFDETFKRITGFFERAVQHKTQMLTVLIEPVLVIFIGVFVGGLALSIFMPIYQISTVL